MQKVFGQNERACEALRFDNTERCTIAWYNVRAEDAEQECSQTPLDVAIAAGNPVVINFLKERGAVDYHKQRREDIKRRKATISGKSTKWWPLW